MALGIILEDLDSIFCKFCGLKFGNDKQDMWHRYSYTCRHEKKDYVCPHCDKNGIYPTCDTCGCGEVYC